MGDFLRIHREYFKHHFVQKDLDPDRFDDWQSLILFASHYLTSIINHAGEDSYLLLDVMAKLVHKMKSMGDQGISCISEN